ncbi:MAG: ATP-binding cassette domain-containing protein, partial [Candidatus Limnocylindrus sp.]
MSNLERMERDAAVDVPATEPVVTLRDVSVQYPSGHTALEGVSLTINRGEFAFLVGPSGAGKSSLIGLLVRDVVPASGEVHVAGHAVHSL